MKVVSQPLFAFTFGLLIYGPVAVVDQWWIQGIEDYILHFLHPGFITVSPRTSQTYCEKICSCKFLFSLSVVVFWALSLIRKYFGKPVDICERVGERRSLELYKKAFIVLILMFK